MDEVYTCRCGNYKWTIHDLFIQCTRCKEQYRLKWQYARSFNEEVV